MISEQHARDVVQGTDMLVQVRDLGGRLEHVVTQYDRLVRELLREESLPSGFNSHIHLVNREIGLVTRRLQDLIVQQYETRRNQELRSTEGADRRRRKPREVPMPRAIDRSSVVRPFIPAMQRHRQPMVAEPTRFAAAR